MFTINHQVDLPDGGLLRARLVELEKREIPRRQPKPGEEATFIRLNWHFEVTEQGDYFGKKVKIETGDYFSDSPYNVPGNIARALLSGQPLNPGTVVSEDDFTGLEALVEIGYEADRNDKAKKWARVAQVFPLDPASAGSEPPF